MSRYASSSLRKIIEKEMNGDLYLPVFQRGFKWARKKQKSLLSSFLVDIPIGAVLFLDGDGDEFAKRRLCFRDENRVEEATDCKYLLDGQQRISTLKSMFYDFFGDPEAWEDVYDTIYPPLQNRWYLCLEPDDDKDKSDIFGLDDLKFNEENIRNYDSNDIRPYIKCVRIFIKDDEEWTNPEYVNSILDGEYSSSAKTEIARKASSNWMIPLFSLMSDSESPLHKKAVEQIAFRRKKDLQAKIEDGAIDIRDVLDLDDGYDDNDVEMAWSSLQVNWQMAINNYLNGIIETEVPYIGLRKGEVDRAVSIFDNMNKGGTPLSTFDLVAARAAQDRPRETSIVDQIIEALDEPIDIPTSIRNGLHRAPEQWRPSSLNLLDDDDPPTKTTRKHLLNILSTLHYAQEKGINELGTEHAKKREQLNMSSKAINSNLEACIEAFSRAACFLQLRCGITKIGDLSYDLMILPIAHCLIDEDIWSNQSAIDKIEYWYWSSIFSGHYRESQNSRSIEDISFLLEWIKGDSDNQFEPRENGIFESSVYSDESMLLRDLENVEQYPVPTAIHESILQYVLSCQPVDFLPKDDYGDLPRLSSWLFATEMTIEDKDGDAFAVKPEKHHICPLSGATSLKESAKELRKDEKNVLNSPVMKSIISNKANQIIRDKSESEYFDYLSSIAPSTHLLPDVDDFGREDGEHRSTYYSRLAKKRFRNIKDAVANELDLLKG